MPYHGMIDPCYAVREWRARWMPKKNSTDKHAKTMSGTSPKFTIPPQLRTWIAAFRNPVLVEVAQHIRRNFRLRL